jgi:NAD(P)-dependent dehydrogenase (short-subunit alcohol dehydrogenase family)
MIPHLRAGGGGSIIFVGSISGTHTGAAYPGNLGFLFSYACAKAAVLRMTTVLANELAEINVRVNAISPGCIETPPTKEVYGEPGTELRRVVDSSTLSPRLGEPLDIAKAALFLASEQSSWITGQNLIVDGGFIASGGKGQATEQDKAALAPLVAAISEIEDAWETTGAAKPR